MKGILDVADASLQHERFVRLFAANEPSIRAFVRRLVPVREDVHDVMQEVAVMLWRKFDPTHGDDDFRRWAFGVARYEVLAWRRDKARDRHVLAEEVLVLLADEAAERDDDLGSQREALGSCLKKLAPSQHELLMAAYSAKDGIQAVAERSGRSVRGFYQWLYRVRQTLLDCVRRFTKEASA